MSEEANNTTKIEEKKYQPFTAEFEDFYGKERKETIRLSRPGRQDLILMSRTNKDKQFDVLCKVMLRLVHPEDKEKLNKFVKDEPVLATSFATTLMKSCGGESVNRGN